MRAVWWQRAIERRLAVLAAMALVLWVAVTATGAVIAARRVTRTLVDERASHARHIAARVEHELEDELRRLDAIAAAVERGADTVTLASTVQELHLADAVLRLAPDGTVRWARAVRHGDVVAAPVPAVALDSSRRWRAQPTDLLDTATGARTLLLVPARESDPEGGALAAVIAPDTPVLAAMLAEYRDDAFVVALVDAHGAAIARSRAPGPQGEPLLASAAVPRTTWAVQLSQPRTEALPAVRSLLRILIGSSLLLAVVGVLMAWGAARSIRQPVERLTSAAERLAEGALDEPIAGAGHDEIGRLAQALERLRAALRDDERRSLLLRRVLSVQEDERRRIARELHDETTQQLTALALQLDMTARQPGDAAAALKPARQLVNTMIDGLHRVIYDLRPSVLDDLGLVSAIRSYARANLEVRGMAVHYELPDEIPQLAPEATTAVYRVVQEALTNVMRHAGAEAVQIACTVSDGILTIEIEDDGAGFDPARMSNPRRDGQGLGLLGMRERLALLGGRLDIDAAPAAGTRVTLTLPLTEAVLPRPEVSA